MAGGIYIGTRAITKVIHGPPAAPTVTITMTPANVIEGAVLAFVATGVSAGALTYQWNLGGVAIAGATLATYDRTTVIADNAGVITCTVTDVHAQTGVSAGQTMVVTVPVTPVVFVGATAFHGSSTASTVIAYPAGVLAGDILIACVYLTNTEQVVTWPAGYTEILAGNQAHVAWAIAVGGETSVTATWPGGAGHSNFGTVYRNASSAGPAAGVNIAQGAAVTSPAIAAIANGAVISVSCHPGASGTAPAGYVERFRDTNNWIPGADKIVTVTGTEPAATWVGAAGHTDSQAVSIVVNPK
jgi:hypothetical protein